MQAQEILFDRSQLPADLLEFFEPADCGACYMCHMVEICREIKRVLRSDGTFWLNIGSSFATSSTISAQSYKLRKDLPIEERQRVAMGMFGLWVDQSHEKSKGTLPDLLFQRSQTTAVSGGPNMASQTVSSVICEEPNEDISADNRATPPTEMAGGGSFGREMRLLRRDGIGVPNDRSHKRRRSSAQKGALRSEKSTLGENLSRHSEVGISEGSFQSPMFQLQLLDRLLGILSTHTFSRNEIPDFLISCFEATSRLKPKDDMLIPARLAIRLQADGWYVRSEIVWAKDAPMPESVTDRPTCAHEKIWLLTKSARYFYDAEAVREPTVSLDPDHSSYRPNSFAIAQNGRKEFSAKNEVSMRSYNPAGRNLRNLWRLPPAPFPEAHFATFPPELPRRCIMAGTSEKGVCRKCAAPWMRLTRKTGLQGKSWHDHNADLVRGQRGGASGFHGEERKAYEEQLTETLGWRPTCRCNAGAPVPATVLDPFAGAGTTLLAADQIQRHAIGIELNPTYSTLATTRIQDDAPLFTQIATL